MRHVSAFAGCDAVGLAVRALGGETVAYSEFDPTPKKGKRARPGELAAGPDGEQYPQRILAKRLPDAEPLGDVCKVDWRARELKFHLFSAGFPCQDLSAAGNGAGLDGARSGLYREVVRAIKETRPELVLIENVPRLLGLHFERLLRDIDALGYDCEWDCIPAAAVDAPHLRDRLWVLAYPRAEGVQPRAFGRPKRISPLRITDDGVKWPRAGLMASGWVLELEPIAPRKTKRVDGRTYWAGVNLLGGGMQGLWPTPERSDSTGGRVSLEMGGHRPSVARKAIPLATAVAHGLWPEPMHIQRIDGLLPTPSSSSYGSNQGGAAGRVGPERFSLEQMARNGMLLPTPTVNDSRNGRNGRNATAGRNDGSKRGHSGTTLSDLAFDGSLWPTPRAAWNENRGTKRAPSVSAGKHGAKLAEEVAESEVDAGRERGSLNPDWVEWMQGLPVGWTDVDCDEPVYKPFWDEHLPRVLKECPNRRQRLQVVGNSLVWLIPYVILTRYRDRTGHLPGQVGVDYRAFAAPERSTT